jgi:hypothetical protein
LDHPHLLLCEGVDAKYFLIWFLRHLIDLSGENSNYDDFQVDDYGGITELRSYLKLLPSRSGFADSTNTAKSITIIRDAENDASAASKSVSDALRDCNFAVPSEPCNISTPSNEQHKVNVAYTLFPAFNSVSIGGTLEDLCLNTLSHTNKDTLLKIADGAVSSVAVQVRAFSREHKNKLHMYLSLTDEYVGLKIGESAKAKAFDFSASNMAPLKELLDRVCKS